MSAITAKGEARRAADAARNEVKKVEFREQHDEGMSAIQAEGDAAVSAERDAQPLARPRPDKTALYLNRAARLNYRSANLQLWMLLAPIALVVLVVVVIVVVVLVG